MVSVIPHLSFNDEESKAQKILYDLRRAISYWWSPNYIRTAHFQSSALKNKCCTISVSYYPIFK